MISARSASLRMSFFVAQIFLRVAKQKLAVFDVARCEHSALLRLQHLDEGFLRDVDLADALHPLLTFLLLLEQLALARDVAAVAFRGHVLAQAETLSRAMILPPIAAWIATW